MQWQNICLYLNKIEKGGSNMERIHVYFPVAKRCFINSLLLLLIIILICCYSPPTYKVISVPYFSQRFLGWCGAACVQMWSHYDGYNPTQQEIASQMSGWTGSDPNRIADAVTIFTNSLGYSRPYGDSELQQDLAIAAQGASINDNVPSVSIIDSGTHAGLFIGWNWTDTFVGPRADEVCWHDPQRGPTMWRTVRQWKQSYFTTYYAMYWIVLGHPSYPALGEDAYWEFLAAGGHYYGGEEEYYPQE